MMIRKVSPDVVLTYTIKPNVYGGVKREYVLLNDERCQTLSYIRDAEMFLSRFKAVMRGISRVVPVGRTPNLDLIRDGYNLVDQSTRIRII